MVYDKATLRASSVRLSIYVPELKVFRIVSHDVNQAYVQSKDQLTRQVFVIRNKEDYGILGIAESEIIEIIRPLYVILDAGYYWGVTVGYQVEEDVKISTIIGDPDLYSMISDGNMEGVMGIYVDDNLNAGTLLFEKVN